MAADEASDNVVISATTVNESATALAHGCRRLHARGLVAGTEGNCSVRLPDGTILITASGVDKATISVADVLRRHANGTAYHKSGHECDTNHMATGDSLARPSSELQMHLCIYAARADVQAIVHAHPPAATGFATAGRTLPANVLPELAVGVGPAVLVPYARPGTSALGEAILAVVQHHEVFLLANHGVTVVGTSLTDAMTRMESVEQAARILMVAELLGGPRVLPGEEAEALAQVRRTSPLPPAVVLF